MAAKYVFDIVLIECGSPNANSFSGLWCQKEKWYVHLVLSETFSPSASMADWR